MSSASTPSHIPDRRPSHWRLGEAVWAIIMAEYRAGATAPELSEKWQVSEHAIRKRITDSGSAKRDHSDAQAMAAAAGWEAEKAARRPLATAQLLFEVKLEGEETLDDPALLARMATAAAGRAMLLAMWQEAKALTALAESYGRIAARAESAELTLDNAPLWLIARAAADGANGILGRLSFTHPSCKPDREDDPDNQARTWFSHQTQAARIARSEALKKEYWHGHAHGKQAAEREYAERGGPAPAGAAQDPSRPDG